MYSWYDVVTVLYYFQFSLKRIHLIAGIKKNNQTIDFNKF